MSDIEKLIALMESLDSLTSEDASAALRNLMQNGQGIGRLVEYYCRNQSIRALELLCIVQEPHEKILLDKIKDAINNKKAVLSTIILLGQIIQKEPSWLPKVPNHSVFSTFLHHINECKDPKEIIAGLLLLASLLPFCSRMNGSNLFDLFKTFLNILCFLRELRQQMQKRPAHQDQVEREIDKIHLSHLQYSVVQFFIILYGIFPCNLIAFIRKVAKRGSEEQRKAIEMHIGPLFSLVRLHPSLAFMSSKKETAKERWVQREPHDFFADSRRLTIGFAGKVDVTDGTLRVKEFDTCSQSSSTSGSTIKNMNYGIILPPNLQVGNDDDWSPNELDLDTPSDDRSLSPIHFHGRSQSTIIPNWERSNSQISQRRPSLGQRMTSFFRSITQKSQSQDGTMSEDGTSSRSSVATFRRHLSGGPSMDNALPGILDDEEDEDDSQTIPGHIEIVSAQEMTSDHHMSSLEEGVDAAAECSPVAERRSHSQTPKASTEEEPGFISAEWRSRSSSFLFGFGRATASSNHSSIHDAPTETADHSAAALFLATPRQSRANTDDEELVDDDEEGVDEHCQLGSFSLPKDSGRTETEVHRMLFRINRKRFCSECPQSTISPDALLLRETLKHNNNIREEDLLSVGTSIASHPLVLKRSRSLPVLSSRQRRRVRIQPEVQIIAGRESDDESHTALEAEDSRTLCGLDYLSQHKLVGLLPYLPLIRKNDSDVGIEDLIVEFELYRERYLDASARHHKCLRELGLADKAPGRIYDDLSRLLEGMSPEKQCELLKTRLILVNQHLMYERCGRLMHGVRNRRLFGRLKQQKALEAEILTLKKSRHSSVEHNNTLVNLLSDLRQETNNARKKEKEKYHSLEKLYGEALKKRAVLEERVVHLEKQRNIDKEIIEQLREDLDASRRCHNDTEARLIFAKRQLQDVERMKVELINSQKQLQRLRDGMMTAQHENNLHSTISLQNAAVEAKQAENDEIVNVAENEIRQLKEENRRLKIECERANQQAATSDTRARDEAIKANDMRIDYERKCRIHKDQYDAAQHKFSTLMTVLAKQESYINVLYNEIEKLSDKPYIVQDPLEIPHREVPSETCSYDGSFCGSNSGNGYQNDLFMRGDGIRREFSAQDFDSRFRTKNNTL